jgi:hypothetical protein
MTQRSHRHIVHGDMREKVKLCNDALMPIPVYPSLRCALRMHIIVPIFGDVGTMNHAEASRKALAALALQYAMPLCTRFTYPCTLVSKSSFTPPLRDTPNVSPISRCTEVARRILAFHQWLNWNTCSRR